ncbi:hypothetical protein IC235_06555 [Hymenobacter sp. BT664]|uniref:Uncharacterized protein n=1 Tax=Hymenobacter montanus TaxID=2771359 RepID=A0A927BCE5_9BACT|nr:hypothetical protein [Hymenobacter montanus]MBD2767549.1 hypothetical protein [Hymenobacter montanus]
MGTSAAAHKNDKDQLRNEKLNFKITIPDEIELTTGKVEKILKSALAHLPNLTAVAIVSVATGTCLAQYSRLRSFNPAVAASYNAEIVRQKKQAIAALSMRGERLEDILIPLRKQLHLIRLAKNSQWFVYLVVKAQDTSLAVAREVLKAISA